MVALLCILLVLFIYIAMIQRYLVRNELQDVKDMVDSTIINSSSSTVSSDDIKKRLNRTISIGSHKKVEKACKEYLSDVLNETSKVQSLTDEEELSNVLSADNIKTDGPDFKKTQEYLQETSTELEGDLSSLIDLMSKKTIMSYVEKKKVSKRYVKFYEEIVIGKDEDLEQMQASLENNLQYYSDMFDTFEEAIEFLKTNKSWKVENDKLVFSVNSDYKKYNDIIKKLK